MKFNSKKYFSQMRQIKEQLTNDFVFMLEQLNAKYPFLKKDFNYLYYLRINNKSALLRPYFTKCIYEMFNTDDWKKHTRLLSLIEVINISTYQSNLAFDDKIKTINEESKFNQLISSFFSTFMFYNETLNIEYDEIVKHNLIHSATNRLKEIYYGQYIDINILSFANIDSLLDYEHYRKLYIERCKCLGSSLIQLCIEFSIAISKNVEKNTQKKIIEFGELFGFVGQILNDLGDLTSIGRVYSKSKYSDIKNGRLTLPIYLLLKDNWDTDYINLVIKCNDPKLMTEMINKVRSFVEPYIYKINIILDELQKSGYKINDIRDISNMLIKSKFYEFNCAN